MNNFIEKASRLLGIPKSNATSIFKDKTDEEAMKLLNDIETTMMPIICKRLGLEKIYSSLLAECFNETNLCNIIITEDTFKDEMNMKLYRQASKRAIKKLILYINQNDKFIKVKYSGKNITSRCSKLPHIPHYNIEDRSFCCGVTGDIKLINYNIRINTLIDKVNGNRSRCSAMKGAYLIQLIPTEDEL